MRSARRIRWPVVALAAAVGNRAQELCDAFASSAIRRVWELIRQGGTDGASQLRSAAPRDRGARTPALPYKQDRSRTGWTGCWVPISSSRRTLACPLTARRSRHPGGRRCRARAEDCEAARTDRARPRNPTEIGCLQGPVPRPSPVIIAIIDDGVGIANHRFRKDGNQRRGSHIFSICHWPVRATAQGQSPSCWAGAGQPPQSMTCSAAYPDDEERVYRALGLIDTTGRAAPAAARGG